MKNFKKYLSLVIVPAILLTQLVMAAPVAAAASGPDLIVTGITWAPTTPTPGSAVTFTATVKNQGDTATPSGTVVGCQFQVDGTEVSWSDTDSTSLAAGGTVQLTANNGPAGVATWNATTGTHTILAWVDDVNRIAESNENNNQYSTSMTVSGSGGQPDLIVTGITQSPASPVVGDATTFSCTVKNQGTGATPAGTIVGAEFQVDGTEVSWSDTNTNSLAAGASEVLTANNGPSGKATWAATSGTHTILAWVDDVNRIAESNESNNQYSQSLTVGTSGGQPDLIVTGITTNPASPLTGNEVTFSATVKNQGTAATPAGTEISCQFQVDGSEVTWSDNDTTSLAAGGTVVLTADNGTDGATWTATAGTHTILAWVDDAGKITESNESNNQYSTSLTVGTTNLPDLIITGITSSPASPNPGDAVTFTATVKNQGAATGAPGTVAFTVDGTQVATSANNTTALAVNGTTTMQATTTWSAIAGSHTIAANVDINNITTESNESNNSYSTSLTVSGSGGGSPDLIVTNITSNPASPLTGNAVTFSCTVKNQGTGATPAGTILGCQFDVDGTEVSWSDTDTTSLGAGNTVVLTANNGPQGVATWNATTGNHTILAWVDDVNRIAESNETNNQLTSSLAVTVSPMPDFVITGLTASPTSPTQGNAVTFTATIKNQGTAAGAPGETSFSVDGNQVFATAVDNTSLAAGSTRTATGTWTADGVGSHSITATSDATNITSEGSETNNTYGSTLTVSPQPGIDLIVTGITYTPQYVTVGNAVSFTATVKNQGTVSGTAGVVGFNVDGTQVAASTNNQTAIAAGSSLQITASGTWSATSGTHSIVATADINNTTTETNENNNSYTSTMTVGSGAEGATMPYTDYLAANGSIGGGAILHTDPTSNNTQIADEATNQAYVGLPSNGSYVQWTVNQGGAGVDMRFTMPDSSSGMGNTGSLDCYVNGSKVSTINLSSYWAYQYFNSGDPSDAPGATPAFQFDEVHWVLPTALKSGDVLKIMKTNGDGYEYGVDFCEVEPVPSAITQPANSLSPTSYGAVANDGQDDLAAFNACVAACVAQGKTMYIPAGTFDLSSMWVIGSTTSPIANITITGAGIWYTNIQFTSSQVAGGGISVRLTATGKIDFSNVYMNSELRSRYNENAIYKAFMDNFGVNSTVHDVWEDHFECGFWVADYAYNPCQVATGFTVQNCRIRDNLADGVNFCNGTSNSTVINCDIRNGGDDGLACWPNNYNGAPSEVNNTYAYDTIEHEWRSAGIALYGGSGHLVEDCTVSDTFMSAGIRMNTTFPGYHFQSNTGITYQNITLISTGTSCDCWQGEDGAIELESSTDSIQNVTFTGINILATQRDAIQIGWSGGYSGILFQNVNINGTGLDGVITSKYSTQHKGGAVYTFGGTGTIAFKNLTTSNIANPNINLISSGYTVTFS